VSLIFLEDIFLEIYLNILDLTFEALVQACVCYEYQWWKKHNKISWQL